jgi:hypothetical protein
MAAANAHREANRPTAQSKSLTDSGEIAISMAAGLITRVAGLCHIEQSLFFSLAT